jgi:thiol-disulfide isomerase/thioredoxin
MRNFLLPSSTSSTSFNLLNLFSILLLSLGGCLVTDNSFTGLAPGKWRGVLELEEVSFPVRDKDTIFVLNEQFKEGELPFNFEVTYTGENEFFVTIFNGSEQIRCDSITYGRDRTTARDTVNIYFPEYQSYIHADVRGGVMQGEWVVTTKDNYRIPFYAKAGLDYRFTNFKKQPARDISGQWATLFGVEGLKPDKALAEFKQEGNRLTGTFRTETGDYRFLEGTIQGRKFWLSCFDGAHAYLFKGSISGDSLRGEFRSGTHYRTLWTAWNDPNFQLGNPDTLTSLKKDGGAIQWNHTTIDGKELRYPSADFDGKVKIFTIMGTWCPNCMDEQRFLTEYLKTHPEQAAKTAVVSFAFEKGSDKDKITAHLQGYKTRLGIPFDLVYAGKADKEAAQAVFPALERVMAFPTIIIIDKQGTVRRIHTGFDGPATSKYDDFKKEFEQLLTQLTKE